MNKQYDVAALGELSVSYTHLWIWSSTTVPMSISVLCRAEKGKITRTVIIISGARQKMCIRDSCKSETAKRFIRDNLTTLCEHGAAMIRLDAFAYATKKAGTSCFFIAVSYTHLTGSFQTLL